MDDSAGVLALDLNFVVMRVPVVGDAVRVMRHDNVNLSHDLGVRSQQVYGGHETKTNIVHFFLLV